MRIPYVITGIGLTEADLQDAMDGVVLIGERQVRRYGLPHVLHSGIVYERERRRAPMPGVERFQTPVDAYVLGHADCDGLAPYHASYLLAHGIDARARVVRSPGIGYHVVVEREDVGGGTRIDDPSCWLGMLDGVGEYSSDAEESARVRRVKRGRAFLGKALGLVRRAASSYGQARQDLLMQASGSARHAEALLGRSGRIEMPEQVED
jgi:hypothetical protein